jgi:ferric-dicitrate binding protein FerR (iron transport regulator)
VDELIVRSLRGETGEIEERKLAEWLAASPSRAREFQDVKQVWDLGECLTAADPEPAPTIQDLLQRSASTQPAERRGSVADRLRGTWVRSALKVAAVLVIAAGTTWTVHRRGSGPGLGAAEFVTGSAESVTVRLGDGTIVRLAPESRLRLTGSDSREVWLDGHAYFAVTKQHGRSFRVRTHAGNVMVLGTRFDLQARAGDVRLLVVEGRVELSAEGKTVALAPSELGSISDGGPPREETVDMARVQEELRWMGDFIVFEATPLGQAARELSAHYGIPVEVLDSTLATETVHGWFANEDLEDVLKILCRAVNAHYSLLPTGATIEP